MGTELLNRMILKKGMEAMKVTMKEGRKEGRKIKVEERNQRNKIKINKVIWLNLNSAR
jgi:hypothetical protein